MFFPHYELVAKHTHRTYTLSLFNAKKSTTMICEYSLYLLQCRLSKLLACCWSIRLDFFFAHQKPQMHKSMCVTLADILVTLIDCLTKSEYYFYLLLLLLLCIY